MHCKYALYSPCAPDGTPPQIKTDKISFTNTCLEILEIHEKNSENRADPALDAMWRDQGLHCLPEYWILKHEAVKTK